MASVELIYGNPIVVKGTEHGTSGEWQVGDLLKIGTDGKLQIATAGLIYAVARTTHVGTENSVHEIELIDPDNVYSARVGAAVPTAVALIGDCADFDFTPGAHYLAVAGATTDTYIVGLDSRDAVGANGGRVLFKFYSALSTKAF